MNIKNTILPIIIFLSFFLLSLTGKTSQTEAYLPINNSLLADSLHNLLTGNKNDTLEFDAIYLSIIKNRRKLKQEYLPLLHIYANKCSKHEYHKGQIIAYDRIGLQYRFNSVFDSSIYYHNLSLSMALEKKDSTQLYYNYNNLGQVYRMQDLNVIAIRYFHKALKITEATGEIKISSFTMNSLGATYVVQKEFDQAMLYFNKSAAIAKKIDDKRTLAYNYGSMGEVFLLKNQNDSAMHYFVASKQLLVKLGSKRGFAVSDHLIGQANYALNEIEEAEKYFRKALIMHNKNKNTRYQALCNAYLGKIKTKINQVDSAEYYLEKAIGIALAIHSFENIILINDALFELYNKTANWQNAINALQQSHLYQDSILNNKNAQQLQSLEIEYETNKKEQQIKLLSIENKNKNQRIKLGIGLISILLISIVLGIYVQIMRKRQASLTQDKLKQQLMLSQMNPHFIFNALASIQSYMYKNDAKKAAAFMGNFASLTRSILNNSDAESISLEEEVSTIQNYLELEKMRMNSTFEYIINIPDEIDSEFIFIPPMMLQPFVENSIKHGLKNIDKDGIINLDFSETETQITITITDNGVGINSAQENKDTKHKSKATGIFKQRMKILQKKYNSIPEPIIQDLKHIGKTGTKVVVCLPIIME